MELLILYIIFSYVFSYFALKKITKKVKCWDNEDALFYLMVFVFSPIPFFIAGYALYLLHPYLCWVGNKLFGHQNDSSI